MMSEEIKTEIELGKAVSCFVFFTRHEGLVSWLIRRITRSKWSHTGIGFNLRNGDSVYFESLLAGGFQGPKDLSKLRLFAEANKRRALAVFFLNMSLFDVQGKQTKTEKMVGRTGYGALQILGMWFWIRVGRKLGWKLPDSPLHMVCSESVARILAPHLDFRFIRFNSNFDEVTPEDIYSGLLGKHKFDVTDKFYLGEKE